MKCIAICGFKQRALLSVLLKVVALPINKLPKEFQPAADRRKAPPSQISLLTPGTKNLCFSYHLQKSYLGVGERLDEQEFFILFNRYLQTRYTQGFELLGWYEILENFIPGAWFSNRFISLLWKMRESQKLLPLVFFKELAGDKKCHLATKSYSVTRFFEKFCLFGSIEKRRNHLVW